MLQSNEASRRNVAAIESFSIETAANAASALPEADVVIYAVSDDALEATAAVLAPRFPAALHVHTSGSRPLQVLADVAPRAGVLYPLMTLSKGTDIDFRRVPLFVETADAAAENASETAAPDLQLLTSLAQEIGASVTVLTSEKRLRLHLAAVFANNFANHCFAVAAELLADAGVGFDALLPLIDETARKVHSLEPRQAQTGPAVRMDGRVVRLHESLLSADPLRAALYKAASESIFSFQQRPSSSLPFPMINYDLKKIRAIAFDVDGVLSANNVLLLPTPDGQPVRTANIKDGYAMQLAVKRGLRLAIITGGKSHEVWQRYDRLGVQDLFVGVSVKIETYESWLADNGLSDEEVIYVGDDIPDYEVMSRCGCACCPADAAPEIRQIARYVSPQKGGDGVARDVIEQVLRAQGLWMNDAQAFGW